MTDAEQLLERADIQSLYPLASPAELAAQQARYAQFAKLFHTKYGAGNPQIAVRSPGRVNLIGEHIDYSDFSVLPMAVDRDMVLAVSFGDVPAEGEETVRVRLANVSNDEFPDREMQIPADPRKFVEIDPKVSDWSNYFKCGVVVAQEYLTNQAGSASTLTRMRPMDVLVTGNVPTGSGLSSSAAFVVCVTLAVLLGYGVKPTRKLLTGLSIKCEQHVGVNSGGMDQSASIYGMAEHALFVTFKPELSATPFSFSEDKSEDKTAASAAEPFSFMIANSLVVSNKHETAPTNYNLRVVEVTLAALVLAKHIDANAVLPPHGNLQAGTLRNVLELVYPGAVKTFGTDASKGFVTSIEQLGALEKLADEVLGASEDVQGGGHSTEAVAKLLGVSVDELKQRYMTTYPVRYSALSLRKRAVHVFSEAARVFQFLNALSSSTGSESDDLATKLGAILNASHQSAISLFDNSHPTVDRLCSVARQAGTLGSRITGAGWGGATVHLVPASKTGAVVEALKKEYYAKEFPNASEEEVEDALILSNPGNGTTILVDDFFKGF